MNSKIKDNDIDCMFKAILSLESIEECYNFFEDLCTIAEIKEMSKRLKVAKMLDDNVIYSDIASQTGLSTATISRVNRCLKYGSDGYRTVLDRLSHENICKNENENVPSENESGSDNTDGMKK